ncbi:MAG: OmpH family outer membrane protein, partial [Sulfurihydrogenibium sp.]
MKKLLVTFSLVALMFLSDVVKAADIVFIDVQTIVNNSKAGKDAQRLLEEAGKKAQEEVEAKQKTLKQDQKSQEEFQAFAIQKQQEVLKRRDELLSQFMNMVQQSLEKFAKEKNYSLII